MTSDIFGLGGHSLLATHLLSQVQAEFDREVSLYTLFTNPTVAQLAAMLDADDDGSALAPLTPAAPGTPAVASSAQVRLWALDQLGDDVVRHNTTAAVELRGHLDGAALHRALDDVVARHELLRTTFRDGGGEPEPVVHPHLDPWVEPLDLTDLPAANQARALRRAVTGHAAHRYDLAAGPLLRARLVRLPEGRHQLLLGMHHIVCDNTSWSVLLADLAARYAYHVTGAGGELPPLPVQFADYARHQRDWLASPAGGAVPATVNPVARPGGSAGGLRPDRSAGLGPRSALRRAPTDLPRTWSTEFGPTHRQAAIPSPRTGGVVGRSLIDHPA